MVKNNTITPDQDAIIAAQVRNNPSFKPAVEGPLTIQALAEREAQLERGYNYKDKDSPEEESAERTKAVIMETLESASVPAPKARTKLFSAKSANPKYLADKPGHERISFAQKLDRDNAALVEKNGHVIGGNNSLALTHEAAAANADTFIVTKEPAKAPATFAEDMAARRAKADPLGLSGSFNHTAIDTQTVTKVADPALDLAANRPVFDPKKLELGLDQA